MLCYTNVAIRGKRFCPNMVCVIRSPCVFAMHLSQWIPLLGAAHLWSDHQKTHFMNRCEQGPGVKSKNLIWSDRSIFYMQYTVTKHPHLQLDCIWKSGRSCSMLQSPVCSLESWWEERDRQKELYKYDSICTQPRLISNPVPYSCQLSLYSVYTFSPGCPRYMNDWLV